jgi:Mg2+ and Co2+ transporter CorA
MDHVDISYITGSKFERFDVDDLPALRRRDDGVLWVDIIVCDAEARRVLSDVFGFHPIAVQNCVERNRIPKVHAYGDHLFLVVHTPERGRGGHIHYVELDLFIGFGFVVTVHGPLNPAVDPEIALRETGAVRSRIEAGRFHPGDSVELTHAIMSGLIRTMETFLEELTEHVWGLEQRVTAGEVGNPERFLEELFATRHGLLALGTMASHSREVYGRMTTTARLVPPERRPLLDDVVDQFQRVHSLAAAQRGYLEGVIDFYRTRTETKMTIAAERLAVVAVVTLPITALASVYGMNIIVNTESDVPHLIIVLAIMAVTSALLLVWAKRHGWW